MKLSETIKVLRVAIKNRRPLCLVGSPGIGKTDIIQQACESIDPDTGKQLARLLVFHPVVSDPTDFKGFPFIVEAPTKEKNGKATFVPFGELVDILTADEPTAVLFDDLGQAPQSVMAAAMQLFRARRINGHKVSDFVTFFAATNRVQDKAGVNPVIEPLKQRFQSIIEIDPDFNDWVSNWAVPHNVPAKQIAFLAFRKCFFNDFKPTTAMTNSPSPRTNEHVAQILTDGYDESAQRELVKGAAGEAYSTEMFAFFSVYTQLPDLDFALKNPGTVDLPTEPSALVALSLALADKASKKNMAALVEISFRIAADNPEYAQLLVQYAVQKAPEIQGTIEFGKWAKAFAAVLIRKA